MDIYDDILDAATTNRKLLAVLVDPDKMKLEHVSRFMLKVNRTYATHIFVGGSKVEALQTDILVKEIKKHTRLPVVLFPGDVTQITPKADGILFLSLISGRNPDYLIGKHVEAVSKLVKTNLQVIPTGYILIENGKQTAVERVSKTKPMFRNDVSLISDTAKAGELLGMKLMYLEAGSGAMQPVDSNIIAAVRDNLNIPLIVGGGIRSKEELNNAYTSGADLVVIGTAIEDNENFLNQIKKEA